MDSIGMPNLLQPLNNISFWVECLAKSEETPILWQTFIHVVSVLGINDLNQVTYLLNTFVKIICHKVR